MKKYIKAFTLVELIIVITILAILGSIGFISFQGYTKNARDASRLGTMNTLETGLQTNKALIGKSLMPDDYTEVLANTNTFGYEGIVGENVSRGLQLNNTPTDPKTGENYIYYTDKNRDKIQLMGFLEGEEMTYLGVSKAQVAGSGIKIPKVTGDRLGILLDLNDNRITGTSVDIVTTNTSYTLYFSNNSKITGTGNTLKSGILDTSGLLGYWDMETTFSSGGITYLKDLSGNLLNGEGSGAVVIGGTGGKLGSGTYFNGTSNWIGLPKSSLYLQNNYTWAGWIKTSSTALGSPVIYSEGIPLSTYTITIEASNNKFNLYSWNKNKSDLWLKTNTNISTNMNEWEFMVFTFNNGKLRVYKNGEFYLESTSQIEDNDSLGSSGKAAFGGNVGAKYGGNQSTQYFNGALDEVRIYNRVLSDSEIKQLYNFTK